MLGLTRIGQAKYSRTKNGIHQIEDRQKKIKLHADKTYTFSYYSTGTIGGQLRANLSKK